MAKITEDVIDYAAKKRESSTQPTETRKKRRVQDEEKDENDSPQKIDPTAPDASETSDDKLDDKSEERSNGMAEGRSNQIQPQLVPSGPAVGVIPPGQNFGSSLSQKRGGITPRLSPTLVNDASVFYRLSNRENENHHKGDITEDANSRERAEEDIEGSTKGDNPSVSNDRVHVPDASTTNEFSVTGDIKPSHVPGESIQPTITNDSSERLIPASILEKGIISFFYRPRVGLKGDSQSVEDIAQTYFMLRPILSIKETIPEIPVREDSNTACLLSLPKKIWPKSGQDKSLCFVDGANMTVKELQNRFNGSPQILRANFITDGVYAILSTGRENHLAYHLTHPQTSELQLQKNLGIKAKGSFVCLVKNPSFSSRTYLNTDHVVLYSNELQKNFGDSRWTPLVPKHLIYEGTQMLLIGQGESKVKNDENNNPEEMNELEQEDYGHVEALKEDDYIFADLEIDAKVLSEKQASWNQESKV
ncbi:24ea56d7-69f9-4a0f-ba56-fd62ac993fc7 [Sclerotinia trifoliorum]|uniref:24ea56d7-69f9-4a0f-ba56-fd62ac993fc7 n=1 Tax=Sclerotinia trifoliorum TaxID=28548 RepID=A0A8H2ZLF6_9HELO|nr:24ea56d7-69f9-4a0f-ba56-fd62ac993fc7 [Sclerotinia trifoliorum]